MQIEATPDAKKLIRARRDAVRLDRGREARAAAPADLFGAAAGRAGLGSAREPRGVHRVHAAVDGEARLLGLEVRGFLTKLRIKALWNGCAFVV